MKATGYAEHQQGQSAEEIIEDAARARREKANSPASPGAPEPLPPVGSGYELGN